MRNAHDHGRRGRPSGSAAARTGRRSSFAWISSTRAIWPLSSAQAGCALKSCSTRRATMTGADLRELSRTRCARAVLCRRAGGRLRCADRLLRDPGAAYAELRLFIQQGGRVLRPYPGKTDALVLDHAGNTRRFGLLEDFDPPTELSMIDKKTDKRARYEKSGAWECRNCNALNSPLHEHLPGMRHTASPALDGDRARWRAHPRRARRRRGAAGPTVAKRSGRAICMIRYFGESKGMKNPAGWAWFAMPAPLRIPGEQGEAAHPVELARPRADPAGRANLAVARRRLPAGAHRRPVPRAQPGQCHGMRHDAMPGLCRGICRGAMPGNTREERSIEA